ncbi:MAG: type II secretion system F family protein [Pontiella sp.]
MFWMVPTLFALCAGLVAYALLNSLRNVEESYASEYADETVRQLEDVFLFVSPKLILRITHLTALLVFILGFVVAGSFQGWVGLLRGGVAGLLGAGVVYLIPRLMLRFMKRRRLERFNRQLASALNTMSNALKAGFSIQQAFSSVADEGDAPIAQEFSMFLQQLRIGVSFEEALSAMDQRMGSEDLMLMVQSIEIARQTGGNLTEVFDRIAETIRERQRIEGKIKSLTAQGKIQGRVVSAMPLVLGIGMYFIDRQMMTTFFRSTAGIVLLLIVVVLEILGAFFINKIVNIDV